MTLDKKITLYKNLTPVEVRIGNYIMNHKEVILNSTIQDLEKEVFVSSEKKDHEDDHKVLTLSE